MCAKRRSGSNQQENRGSLATHRRGNCSVKCLTISGEKRLPTIIACDTDFIIKIANDPLPKFDWKSITSQNEIYTLPSIVRELKSLKSSQIQSTRRRAKMA